MAHLASCGSWGPSTARPTSLVSACWDAIAISLVACARSQAPPVLGNLVWPLRGWVVPREQTRRPSGRELGGRTGQASAVSRRWVAGW